MSDFVEHLEDLLAGFGPVTPRRMFGGYGIFHEGVMFGLVADDTLYLKVDGESAPAFEARGLPPFEYTEGGTTKRMSYRLAPEEILENPEEAAVWARRAFEAALRSGRSRR